VGGRLDCTNVADGVVAVITPISIDHTRLLGDTVEEIAAEKAGIIKPGATAVLAQQPLAAAEVLLGTRSRWARRWRGKAWSSAC
jgi:Folylpolyglutamate synthase